MGRPAVLNNTTMMYLATYLQMPPANILENRISFDSSIVRDQPFVAGVLLYTSRKVLDCNKQAKTFLRSDVFYLGEEIEIYTVLNLVDDDE